MRSMMRAMLVGAVTGLSVVWLVPGFGASSETPPGNESHQTASPEAQSAEEPQPVAPPKDPVAQCLQDSMNSARTALNLQALPEIPSLLAVAQLHSDRMASQQIMHHSSNEILGLLPAGWRAYGENVVYGKTCEGMFEAFMNSEPHRNAILRPDFNLSGIAVSYGADNWTYATMVFLDLPLTSPTSPTSPAAPAPAPQPAAAPAPAAPAAPPEAAPVVAPPPPVEVPAVGTISLPPLPAGWDNEKTNQAAVGSQAGRGASVIGSFRQAHPAQTPSAPRSSADNGTLSFELAPAGAEISFDLRGGSGSAPAATGPPGGPSGEIAFNLEQRLPEPDPKPSRMS